MTGSMDTYYKELRQNLRCPKADRDRFLSDVRQKVDELDGENPALSCEDVISFLGSPKDLANSLMETLDPVVVRTYEKKSSRSRKSLRVVCIILAALLIFYGAYSTHVRKTAVITEETTIIIGDSSSQESAPEGEPSE